MMRANSLVGYVRWAMLAAVVAAGGAWYAYFGRSAPVAPPEPEIALGEPPAPDPRLTYVTPFRNVRPEVKYVGDAACAGCHPNIDATYHAHPMGRSAAVGTTQPVEQFDAASNPFTVGPYTLRVEKEGDTVRHRVRAVAPDGRPLPDYVTTADLAIGSGTRGRSYVAIEKGAAWQSPISWFGPNARWDLSPGFDLSNGGRRAVVSDCLFCHVNRVEPVPGAVNRYREPLLAGQAAIGCERCHGPGELHVAERTAGGAPEEIDTSIVNPRHLTADLRSSICAQCHLQGEQRVARRGRTPTEYRPGLPLEEFLTVFVRHPDAADLRKSVGQFEQMHQSRCFTASNGRFGCTSCHDPHAAAPAEPAARARYYRGRCETCHGAESPECSERPAVRRAQGDRCTECHMPRTGSANIVHASVTDHRVLRRPEAGGGPRGLQPGTIPLVRFSLGHDVPSVEADRDLGVGLGQLLARAAAGGPAARSEAAAVAAELVRSAVTRCPGDLPAWLALAHARHTQGDGEGALAAAATAVRLEPDHVEARALFADAAARTGQFDTAMTAAGELVRLTPTGVEGRLLRAGFHMARRDWAAAAADCRVALAIQPLHPQARLMHAICLHHLGDPAGGRREADVAVQLVTEPRQREGFREWYESQTR